MNGTDLQSWRKTLNIKPGRAADLLKVARSTYWRWENGKLEVPHMVGLACAAIAHGLPTWGGK